MFDVLDAATPTDAVAATAYGIRMLTHLAGTSLTFALVTLPNEFTPKQRQLGDQIIAAVEAAEGCPVRDLDRQQVRRHVAALYARAQGLWTSTPETAAEARRVLTRFRTGTAG